MNKIKQSFIQMKIIAVAMLLLSACSQEDEYVQKGDNDILSQGIELTVSAGDFVIEGAPDTRATDNGNETTFENGDRVGIIILDEKDKLIYNNIPYKYNGKNNKWVFDSSNGEGKDICYYDSKARTYIVYYPYHKDADGCTNESDLKKKFKPRTDQSTKSGYRASDLMVWSITNVAPKTSLEVNLTHVYASISLSPKVVGYVLDDEQNSVCDPFTPNISGVSLRIDEAIYIPHKVSDGSLRCILPSDFVGDVRCFYTNGSDKTYSNTINISSATANIRYISTPKITAIYSLSDAKVGDFYCKRNDNGNGYLIPGDSDLTDDQKKACVGVVFWVGRETFNEDPLLKKDYPNCTHGLVVALQDAGGMYWSNKYKSVQNWINGSLYKDVVNLWETDIRCGYSNTLALMAYNNSEGEENIEYRILPCDAILQYSIDYPAPTNSSGWYFPSLKELLNVCWGQGGQNVNGWKKLNIYISKVNGELFGSWGYWSSTEDDVIYSYAYLVGFDEGRRRSYGKSMVRYSVRPLLAF